MHYNVLRRSVLYKEAPFHGFNDIIKPIFHRFTRNCKRADIFTTEELNKFFDDTLDSSCSNR